MVEIGKLALRSLTHGIGRSLRHKSYRIFCLTNFVSMIGIWSQRVAIGWLAWKLTESGFWLGVVALSEALPLIVLVPISGAIIDRVDRLNLLQKLQKIQVGIAAILTILVITGSINIFLLTLLSFIYGLVQVFHLPLRITIAPNLVPKEDLTPAIGFASTMFNISRFSGPMLAGGIISTYGVGAAFIFGAVCMIVFSVGLKFVKPIIVGQTLSTKFSLFDDIVAGIKYGFSHSSIGPLLVFIMVTSTFSRAFMDLFPGFADHVFGYGPQGLGVLFSAVGTGGIIGSIWVTNYGKTRGLTHILLISIFLTSIFLIIFASTNLFHVGVITGVFIGICLAVTANASQILIQNTVAEDMRGRVMSLYSLSYRAFPALGALLIGFLSTWMGLQLPVGICAIIIIFSLIVIFPRRHRLADVLEER